jgi:hypothetical protein
MLTTTIHGIKYHPEFFNEAFARLIAGRRTPTWSHRRGLGPRRRPIPTPVQRFGQDQSAEFASGPATRYRAKPRTRPRSRHPRPMQTLP